MSRFAIPSEFHPGAMERDIPCGAIEGVPVFGDVVPVIPESEWLEALRDPNRPQLSKQVWTVLSQASVGSCASESKDGGCMLVRALSGRHPILFNPYGTYGRVNGGSDSGSALSANVGFAKKYGCFPEVVWPRSNGWRKEPTDEAYEVASQFRLDESYDCDNSSASRFYAEFFSAILLGIPTHFGYPGHAILAVEIVEEANAPPEAIECDEKIGRWMLKKGCTVKDDPGGLVNSLYVKYLNSWGDWGDNGFGYLRASKIQRNYGAYPYRSMIESTWMP